MQNEKVVSCVFGNDHHKKRFNLWAMVEMNTFLLKYSNVIFSPQKWLYPASLETENHLINSWQDGSSIAIDLCCQSTTIFSVSLIVIDWRYWSVIDIDWLMIMVSITWLCLDMRQSKLKILKTCLKSIILNQRLIYNYLVNQNQLKE